MIDLDAERAASLQRLGIAPEPRCPCGDPVARGRQKYCSSKCAEQGKDRATAAYEQRRKLGLPTAKKEREERNERIVEMRQNGKSCPEIAKLVGLSESSVFYIVNGRHSPIRDHVRIVLLVDREEAKRWRRCAKDMALSRWVFDMVSSEVERRISFYDYLRSGS